MLQCSFSCSSIQSLIGYSTGGDVRRSSATLNMDQLLKYKSSQRFVVIEQVSTARVSDILPWVLEASGTSTSI